MKKEKESTVVEDYKIYKKRLSKLVLFTDKKEKKSKKRSNRRGEEKRNTIKITPKEEEGYNS